MAKKVKAKIIYEKPPKGVKTMIFSELQRLDRLCKAPSYVVINGTRHWTGSGLGVTDLEEPPQKGDVWITEDDGRIPRLAKP